MQDLSFLASVAGGMKISGFDFDISPPTKVLLSSFAHMSSRLSSDPHFLNEPKTAIRKMRVL
jgi:hypothetical protein